MANFPPPLLFTDPGRERTYSGRAITPDDTAILPGPGRSRGLITTSGGTVAVTLPRGGTAVLTGLVAGVMYYVDITKIMATGTTATGLSCFWDAA